MRLAGGPPLLVTTHSISRSILQRTASVFHERAQLDRLGATSAGLSALRGTFRDRFVCTALALLGHDAREARDTSSPLIACLRDLFDEVSRPGSRRPHVREQLLSWQDRVVACLDFAEVEALPVAGLRGADPRSRWTWVEIDDALFVPPAHDQVPDLLDALDGWLREPVDGPAIALLVAGIALHTIMHVQPLTAFNDLAASLLALDHLSRSQSNPHGLLSLEALWSDPRRLYRAVDQGMWSGDLTGWLDLFLEAVLAETRQAAVAARAAADRDMQPVAAPPDGLNERQRRALEVIRQQGRITNRDYRKLLGVSNKTAHQELRAMVDRKVIRRVGFGRGVSYL